MNPFSSALKFIQYALTERLHFPKDRIGETLALDDGLEWVIFRQVVVDPDEHQPQKPGAIFRARFHVSNMTQKQNKRFSLLPIPFFVGLPGFRSKFWLYNKETGDSSGLYEWDTIKDAENYKNSFAVRFMTSRSDRGSVSFEVIETRYTIN